MSEIVGSLAIELVLDRSKFDLELQKLKNEESITVGVKVDRQSLQRQLKSLELDCIPVKLCPDIAGFKQKLKGLSADPIVVDAQLSANTLNQQLGRLLRSNSGMSIDIDTTKSEQSIQRLSQQVDALRANIRSLNQEQISAPRVVAAPVQTQPRVKTGTVKPDVKFEFDKQPKLKVRLDSSQVERELEISAKPKYKQQFNTPVPGVGGSYTISQNPNLKLNVDSAEIRGAIAQSTSEIVRAIYSRATTVSRSGGFQDTTKALYTGFVESIGASLLPLMRDAIVNSFRSVIPDFQGVFQTGATLISKGIGALTSPFRQVLTGFQQGIGVAISSSFSSGFQKKLETEFGFTFERIGEVSARRLISRTSRVLEKTGAVANRGEMVDLVKSGISFYEDTADDGSVIGGARRRYQEGYKAAAERVKARAAEIAPTLQPTAKDRIAFVSAGYSGSGGRASNTVAESLKPVLNQSEVVPVENRFTDVRYDAMKNPLQWIANAVTNTLRNGLEGSNRDAEEMAAQAYARYMVNPEAQIELVGHSAGGFVASDAQQILKQLGVPSKALSFGTPHFGVLNPNPGSAYRADMGMFDPLSPLNLASPNAQFYGDSTGAGHLAPTYVTSENFQSGLQSFLYDTPKQFTTEGLTAKIDRDMAMARTSLQDLAQKQNALEAEIAKANTELDQAQQEYERQRQRQRKRDRNTARVIADRRAYEQDPEALIARQRQKYGARKASDEARVGTRIPKAGLLETGITPTKQAFQAQVKANKEQFRAQFEAAKSAVGQEKVNRLKQLLKALDDEQDKIEQDIARKLGKQINGVLGNYKGFLGNKGGLRSQIQDQLGSIEAQLGKFEKPKNPQNEAVQTELDQFVKGINQGSDIGKATGTDSKLLGIGVVPALAALFQGGGLEAALASVAASPLGIAGLGAAGVAGGIGAARAARPILEPIAPVLYKDVGEIGRKAGSLLVDSIRSRVASTKDLFGGIRRNISEGMKQITEAVKQADAAQRGFQVGRAQASTIDALSRFDTGKYGDRFDTRRIDPRLNNLGKTYAAGATVAANVGASVNQSIRQDASRLTAPIDILRQAISSTVSAIRNPFVAMVDRAKRGENVNLGEAAQQGFISARDIARSGGRRFIESAQQSFQDARSGQFLNPIKIAQRAITSAREGFGASLTGAMAGSKFELAIPKGLKRLAAVYKASANGADEFRNRVRNLRDEIDRIIPGSGELLNNLTGLAAGFIGFQVIGFAVEQLKQFVTQSVQAAIAMDKLRTSLSFSAGGSSGAEKALDLVRAEADQSGIPLAAAQQGYAKLLASTRGTALQGAASEDLFKGLNDASATLGLTSDQYSGSILALSQIASKGRLQAEELRGQLGERIPGAFGIAARSLNISEAELNKRLEQGSVSAEEFLPKFAKQLQVEFGGAAEQASTNTQANLNRVGNNFLELQQSVGQAFTPAVNTGASALAGLLEVLAQRGDKLIQVLLTLGGVVASAFLAPFAKALLSLKAVQGAIGLVVSGIGAVSKNLKGLGIQFIAITGAMEAVRSFGEIFQMDETGKQFEGLARSGEASLKRIEDAAKRARGEVDKVPDKPKPSTSKGFDLTLGLGKMFGLEDMGISLKTDDVLKFFNSADAQLNRTLGLPEDFGGRLTTVEELQQQRRSLALDSAIETSNAMVGRVFSSDTRGEIGSALQQASSLDQQITQKQNERNRLAAQPRVDRNALAQADAEIKRLNDERSRVTAPVTELQSGIQGQISGLKNQLNQEGLSDEERNRIQGTINQLEKAQASLGKLQNRFGTAADRVGDFRRALAELNIGLEEVQRKAELQFNVQTRNDVNAQLNAFATDENASLNAPVNAAQRQFTRTNAQLEGNQKLLDAIGPKINTPEVADTLAGIVNTTTGKSLTKDSGIEEIERARAGLSDSDPRKKLLDDLVAYKKALDQQTALEAQSAQDRLAIREAEQQRKLALIDRETQKRELANKQSIARNQLALIGRQKNKSISEEDVAIESSRLQEQQVSLDIGNAQQQLEALNAALNAGEISAEQFAQKRIELEGRVSDLTIQKAQAELATRQAIDRKIIESFERRNRVRLAAIDANASDQIFNVKQTQLNGGMVGEGGQAEINKIELSATQQRIALRQSELAEVRKLRDQRVLSEKEAVDRTLALEQDLRDQRSRLIDLQTQEVIRGIQNEVDAQQRASEAKIAAIESEKIAIEGSIALLDVRAKALQSELELQQAISGLRQSTLKGGIDRANEASGLQQQLRGGELGFNAQQVARQQLGELGFSGQNELQILQQRQALQAEADRERLAALQQQQELERQSLQLSFEKERQQAKINQLDRESAVLKAQQNLIVAQGELQKAKITGDANQIANAQAQIDINSQLVSNAQKQLDVQNEINGSLDEQFKRQQQINDLKQQQARQELQNETAANRRQREMEQAQLKDRLQAQGLGVGGMTGGGTGGSAGGGVSVNGNTLTLMGGDITSYDQASKAIYKAIQDNAYRGESAQQEAVLGVIQSRSGREQEFAKLVADRAGFGDVVSLLNRIETASKGTNGIQVASAVNRASTSGGNGDVVKKLTEMMASIEKLANNPRSLTFNSTDPVSDYASFMNNQAGSLLRNA